MNGMISPRWIPLLLIALTMLCFVRLFNAEFVLLDDTYTVEQNPRLNPPSVGKVLSFWRLRNSDGQINAVYGLYMPMTYTFWSGIAAVLYGAHSSNPLTPHATELNAYLFHTANIFLHMISGLLVFAILKRLLRADWAACLGAIVFLIHPVQVEAVAWISGAKDLLAGFFTLLAIWEFMQFRMGKTRGIAGTHYAASLLAALAAMFAKPSAITLPVLLIVVDWMLMRPEDRFLRRWTAAIPFFVFAILFAIVGALAQPAGDVPPAPFWARPFVVGDALAFYLDKLVLPIHLAIDYGRRPAAVIPHVWFYAMWLVPAALAIWVWQARKKTPAIAAGAVIFLVAAAPTLGFTTFLFQRYSTTADHYLYMPMLGIALIAGELARRYKNAAAKIGIVVILAVVTIVQTGYWRDDRSLFSHAIQINPRSAMGHLNLGVAALHEGDFYTARQQLNALQDSVPVVPDAVERFEKSLNAISPASAPAR